jgi:DNA replication and repair protein RecF
LTNFRNYASLRLAADRRPIVLTGPNGAGKTNLLEALSMLGPGRGLRRARLDEIQCHQATEGWAVAATVDRGDLVHQVGTGLRTIGTAERRQIRIDMRTAKAADLATILGLVWLTPQMDRLFLEGASGRRAFLDRILYGFDPGHAQRMAAYQKAMRERNRLLKTRAGEARWLAALEDGMAENGVAVAASRRQWCARLGTAAAALEAPFPVPVLALQGGVEQLLDDRPALAAEEAFRKALADGRRRDAEAGGATFGPHRSDLQVWHRANDMPAAQCSTGEQKALLIGLVLATARLMATEGSGTPLLLLDEIAAHLDEIRRQALYQAILALGAQAWLTGTDRHLFDGLSGTAQFFDVQGGALTPAE